MCAHTYEVALSVAPLEALKWQTIIATCVSKMVSLVDLWQGKFPPALREAIIHPQEGLFPSLDDLTMDCTCFDYAPLCKHIAAVLYGLGARFDETPEDLFLLRSVDPQELFASATASLDLLSSAQNSSAFHNLADLFDIDLEEAS